MSGGEISNNTASEGGGIWVDQVSPNTWGEFYMPGGTIADNLASELGGGVCSDGPFELSGGTITGNRANAPNGGGEVFAEIYCNFVMTDGAISDNYAVFGVSVPYYRRGVYK